MATITVDAGKLGAVIKADCKRLPDVMRQALYAAAQRGRSHLVSVSPVDRGVLKNAWRIATIFGGFEVINDAPYAGVIERGARPHTISEEGMESLTAWVYRKILLGTTKKAKQAAVKRARAKLRRRESYSKGFVGPKQSAAAVAQTDLMKEARRIAEAIRRKIEKFGQEGQYQVRDSMPLLTKILGTMIAEKLTAYYAKGGGAK